MVSMIFLSLQTLHQNITALQVRVVKTKYCSLDTDLSFWLGALLLLISPQIGIIILVGKRTNAINLLQPGLHSSYTPVYSLYSDLDTPDTRCLEVLRQPFSHHPFHRCQELCSGTFQLLLILRPLSKGDTSAQHKLRLKLIAGSSGEPTISRSSSCRPKMLSGSNITWLLMQLTLAALPNITWNLSVISYSRNTQGSTTSNHPSGCQGEESAAGGLECSVLAMLLPAQL